MSKKSGYKDMKARGRYQRRWQVAKNRRICDTERNKPCLDCGGVFPLCVMEYDHTRGTKVASIAELASKKTSEVVLRAEIAKCDVVCANCHRIRTFRREQESGAVWARRYSDGPTA